MYGIKVNYFYYVGTLYAPKDGYMTDENGSRLTFETFQEALDFLDWYIGGVKLFKGKTTFVSSAAFYLLNHGEYSQPEYSIRKLRG